MFCLFSLGTLIYLYKWRTDVKEIITLNIIIIILNLIHDAIDNLLAGADPCSAAVG
jgi:hypothetical protein